MGMITLPGEMEFWEQRQKYERRRLEEARRRARLEAEWWLHQHHRQPQREEPTRDDDATYAVHSPLALKGVKSRYAC